MKNFLHKVIYLKFDKDSLMAIKDDILEANRLSLIVYSSILAGGMGIMLILSFFVDVLSSSRVAYLCAVLLGLIILAIANKPAKTHRNLTVACQYILICFLLIFGILLGTIVEPNQASTSFSILIFVAPLLFTDLPFCIDIVTALSIVVYVILAKSTQSPEMYAFNMSVVMPYGLANLVLTYFTSRQKIERHIYAYEKKIIANYDRLTGMLNRWSFEQDVEKIKKQDSAMVTVCSFDVNRLKQVNDTWGHAAGDELLKAAANSINEVFGRHGKCYRIGGDEFAAILFDYNQSPEELKTALSNKTAEFKSRYGFGLAISMGMAQGYSKGIEVLILHSDKLMYENKKESYSKQC